MQTKTIVLRKVNNVNEMLLTAARLQRAALECHNFDKTLIIKMTEEKIYFPPLSIMYLGLFIRQLKDEYKISITFSGFDYDWVGYLKAFNFFELQKNDEVKSKTLKESNQIHIPIQIEKVPDVSIDDNHVHASEVLRMQEVADDLAKRLVNQAISSNFYVLSYVCREILRNVIEHSYSKHLYYSASYFEKRNSVSVIIADTGDGVRKSLNEMPDFQVNTDRDALSYAVLPGFSGRKHKYNHTSNNDHQFQNSGYGLYLTRRICEEHGNFLILSGNACLSTTNETTRRYGCPKFTGTVLRLVIELDKISSLRKSIDRYKTTAEQMKRVAAIHGKVTTSSASMLVRLSNKK